MYVAFWRVGELLFGNFCKKSALVMASVLYVDVGVRFRPIEGRVRLKSELVRCIVILQLKRILWLLLADFRRNLL